MSCISSNFSSFFLNSLNDSSEFAKYLSNNELKYSAVEDFQIFSSGTALPPPSQQQQQQPQQQYSTQQQQYQHSTISNIAGPSSTADLANSSQTYETDLSNTELNAYSPHSLTASPHIIPLQSACAGYNSHPSTPIAVNNIHQHSHYHHPQISALRKSTSNNSNNGGNAQSIGATPAYAWSQRWSASSAPTTSLHSAASHMSVQQFDGSFEFLKYLRHSNNYNDDIPNNSNVASTASSQILNHQQPSSLIDLDSSTTHQPHSSRKVAALLSSISRTSNSLDSSALDVFDNDSKQALFDLPHIANGSSNSNESSLEISNFGFLNSHLNASNSNTSTESAAIGNSDVSMLSCASKTSKPLATFVIKDNFDVHPSHKIEEGIFQHMNKLPTKKKENLKQLGVRFTGQMTLSDKLIVVQNFIKFCHEYDIKDHRPFLSLNQSGLNKPEQIKFARYLGQGLPTFTLFCVYSNFKNLFCSKRTEIYTKDGYNLAYILDKTKRFLSNTTPE